MSEYNQKYGDESRDTEKTGERHENSRKKQMKVRAEDTPGVICIERHTHDGAIVITGSLVIDIIDEDLGVWIAQELETAAVEIGKSGGTIDQIKTTLAVMSKSVISLTDEKAVIKESQSKRARITLAAIVHRMDSDEAVQIIRKALAAVRRRLRQGDYKVPAEV